jgi:hypothetical protein
MNWKACGRKVLVAKFKVLPRHLPGGSKETTKRTRDSRSSGRNRSSS